MAEGGITSEAVLPPHPVGQEAVNNLIDRVSELRQETSDKHAGLVDVSGNPLASNSPDTSPKTPDVVASDVVSPEKPPAPDTSSETKSSQEPPAQPDNETPQTAEDMTKANEAIATLINSDSEMKSEYAKKLLEASRTGKIDLTKIQQEVLTEHIKKGQEAELSPAEQEKFNKKVIQEACQENLMGMLRATKQATELAKAKINEINLQNDQASTSDQKTKIKDLRTELENKYNLTLEKMKLPKDSQINNLLQKAPENPEILKLLQEEEKKSVIKRILELLGLVIFSAGDEVKKTITADLPLGQQA